MSWIQRSELNTDGESFLQDNSRPLDLQVTVLWSIMPAWRLTLSPVGKTNIAMLHSDQSATQQRHTSTRERARKRKNVYKITQYYTQTHDYGGNDNIRCQKLKNQSKQQYNYIT